MVYFYRYIDIQWSKKETLRPGRGPEFPPDASVIHKHPRKKGYEVALEFLYSLRILARYEAKILNRQHIKNLM